MNAQPSLRRTEVLLALAVLAIFVLLAVFDFQRQTRAVERFDSFSSYDYQHGGYHAWYDLLQREGIRTVRLERRPAYLNESVATLIVANNVFDAMLRGQVGQTSGIYGDADLEALRAWVSRGGRLVWLVDQAAAFGNPTSVRSALRRLAGAKPTPPPLPIPPVARAGTSHETAAPLGPSTLARGVGRLSGTSRLRIPFDADPALTPVFADHQGIVVGWYPLGKGSVVVVTDETLFQNSRIGIGGNAHLAYNVAAAGLHPGDTVAFDEWSHGYQSGDTWWAVTPLPLRVAFCLAGAALALFLLGSVWRFGPVARLPENIERTSADYLISMAALLERGRAARRAVRDLAQIALRAAAHSVGAPESAPASAIAARLRGDDSGDHRAHDLITLERIAGYEQPSADELVQAARLSHDLRKDFSFDGSLKPGRSVTRRSA